VAGYAEALTGLARNGQKRKRLATAAAAAATAFTWSATLAGVIQNYLGLIG
jgi:hypothetical protein